MALDRYMDPARTTRRTITLGLVLGGAVAGALGAPWLLLPRSWCRAAHSAAPGLSTGRSTPRYPFASRVTR